MAVTYTGGEYSVDALFRELSRQVEDENIKTYDEYRGLVDLIVEEKMSYGFFTENEDLEQLKSDLLSKWPEIAHRKQ